MQEYVRHSNQILHPIGTPEQNKRKDTDTERSATEILLAITDHIVDGDPLPDLFKNLVPLLHELGHCDVVSFGLYDVTQNGIVTDFWKKGLETKLGKTFAVEECPCGWVWQHQEPMAIPALDRETRFADALRELRELGVRSYTILPMSTAKRHYGALGFGGKATEGEGTNDLLSLERAARLVGLAVENHEVHAQWQKQKNRLQQLTAISRELSSTLDMEEIIPLVLARMRQVMHYDYGRLALVEAEGRSLRIRGVDVVHGAGTQLSDGQKIPLAGSRFS